MTGRDPSRAENRPGTAVLVVGAGPVGLVMACELARRGTAVRIVDTLTTPTTQSRAILVHARSLELLDRLGVVEEVIASGVVTRAMEMRTDDRLLARIQLDTVDSPFPFSVTTAQTETERILTERLAQLGVVVERGVELTSFTQDEDGVSAVLSHGGRIEQLRTDWIVGTDGAHSTVRSGMGSELVGSFHGETFILGDVEVRHDADLPPQDTMRTQFSATAGPLLVFPMRGRRMRVIAQIEPDTSPVDTDDMAGLQHLLDQRVHGRIQLTESHWITRFEIRHAQVPAYRQGRAFLAGDAAHVHSPAGGQGMNTGMQDAGNLGWKLAAAVAGHAAPGLLDSYHTERHPVAAAVITKTTAVTRLGTLDGHVRQRLRDEVLHAATGFAPVQHALADQTEETDVNYDQSPIVTGRGRRSGVRPGGALPTVAGVDIQRITAPLSTRHVVIHLTGARFSGDAATPVAGMANVLVGRTDDPAGFDAVVDDQQGRVAHGFELSDGGTIVVRPDGYVGSVDPGASTTALERYRELVGSDPVPTRHV